MQIHLNYEYMYEDFGMNLLLLSIFSVKLLTHYQPHWLFLISDLNIILTVCDLCYLFLQDINMVYLTLYM